MGTRSTVKFYDEDNNPQKPILSVYHQFDGYIENGIGWELAKFLKSKTIINGIQHETMGNGFANGMGCLAAQYIAEKKIKIGNLYLTTENDEQLYNYEVRYLNGEFIIKIDNFKGTPEELLAYKEPED